MCFALTAPCIIWNHLEALLKRHSMYTLIVTWLLRDDIVCPQCAHHQWLRIAVSHMNCESSIAIVTKQKAPSLCGRKGSFEGHWSGSYCPGGRQIGPVKPHCESDWNWFVVLLLHHPIKRRNLRESVRARGEEGREWQRGKMRAKEPGLAMAH